MQNIGNTNEKTALGLDANLGALICYVGNFICSLGLIYSIIVLVQDKTNKFVRFNAFQSILCSVLGLVFGLVIGLGIIIGGVVDSAIGFPLLSLLIGLVAIVVGLVGIVMYILAALKAYKGETYKIMIVGNLAERWA